MAKFEKVKKYETAEIAFPVRKTKHSAGYDMAAAEDIIIPSYLSCIDNLYSKFESEKISSPIDLNTLKIYTKQYKPTLISTGMKCKLNSDQYLELSIRSSSPLKYWLILANGVGIIDSDYYNNSDNEGEIFFQVINLSPIDILIKKGDIIGQGIIKKYELIEDDNSSGLRSGGFGSTSEE